MNTINKAMQGITEAHNEAINRGEIGAKEAFQKYYCLVCDLLCVPPDVLILPESWERMLRDKVADIDKMKKDLRKYKKFI